MLPSSQGGSLEIEVKGQKLNGCFLCVELLVFSFFLFGCQNSDLDEVLSLTESES